jgi:hypothetical protein
LLSSEGEKQQPLTTTKADVASRVDDNSIDISIVARVVMDDDAQKQI